MERRPRADLGALLAILLGIAALYLGRPRIGGRIGGPSRADPGALYPRELTERLYSDV